MSKVDSNRYPSITPFSPSVLHVHMFHIPAIHSPSPHSQFHSTSQHCRRKASYLKWTVVDASTDYSACLALYCSFNWIQTFCIDVFMRTSQVHRRSGVNVWPPTTTRSAAPDAARDYWVSRFAWGEAWRNLALYVYIAAARGERSPVFISLRGYYNHSVVGYLYWTSGDY